MSSKSLINLRNFFNEYVTNIFGNYDDIDINYKKDFILTDELNLVQNNLFDKIENACRNYVPDKYLEFQEWYRFDIQGFIVDNEMAIEMENEYYDYVSQ